MGPREQQILEQLKLNELNGKIQINETITFRRALYDSDDEYMEKVNDGIENYRRLGFSVIQLPLLLNTNIYPPEIQVILYTDLNNRLGQRPRAK